jgi:hypothetical protein
MTFHSEIAAGGNWNGVKQAGTNAGVAIPCLANPVQETGSAKKKPADESGLKTIFLEENSGDRCMMRDREIYV